MNLDAATAFRLVNLLAVTGWLVLVVALLRRRHAPWWPRWAMPGVFAAAYLAIVAVKLGGGGGPAVDFGSLAGVQALFTDGWWVVAGWLHYLAFDLWIGVWEVDEAKRLGLPRPIVVVCLALTFMFGPIGWLAFSLLRARALRSAAAPAAAANAAS